jgi:MFS family permease
VRRLTALVSAIVIVDTIFFAALSPLLPDYQDRYDLSKLGVGILTAAYPLGIIVAGLPAAAVAARFGVKRTCVLAMGLTALSTTVFGFAESIALLDAARFTQGVASACAWTGALSWLVGVTPAARRGAVIGGVLGLAIGGALLGPVLGVLAAYFGTRSVFTGVGILAVVIAGIASAVAGPPARASQQRLPEVIAKLRDRTMAAGLWLVMLPGALFGTMTLLASLRLDDLGFGATAIGAVFVVATACEAVLSPLAGHLSDRWGRRLLLMIGLGAAAGVTAILPWPSSAYGLAAVVVVASMCYGLFWAPAFSLLTHRAEALGVEIVWAFGLMNLAWAPGQTLGGVASGAVATATSDAVPYLVLAGLSALSLLAVRSRGRA